MSQQQNIKQQYVMTASLPLIMRLMKTYVFPHWPKLALGMGLMLISAAMTGALAKFLQPVIDDVFTDKNAAMLWPVAITVFSAFAIRGAVTYGHAVIMNSLGQRIISDVNRDMFAHLIYADLAYFHGQQSGQLLSRFISDTTMMRTATVEGLTGLGKNTFTIVALICVMFYQDWKLSMASIFVFPVAFYFVTRIGRRLRKVSHSTQVHTGALTSILGQSLQGARHIKSYGMEEYEKQRINRAVENIFQLVTRAFRISATMSPFTEILCGFAIVTIIIYGGHQVIAGTSTTGKLFSFIAAFLMAFDPMKRLANLNNTMQMGLAAIDRLFKMLDIKPSICDKPGATELLIKNPAVRFDDVRFTYPDGSEALRGVSFDAPGGKTVALVGVHDPRPDPAVLRRHRRHDQHRRP